MNLTVFKPVFDSFRVLLSYYLSYYATSYNFLLLPIMANNSYSRIFELIGILFRPVLESAFLSLILQLGQKTKYWLHGQQTLNV